MIDKFSEIVDIDKVGNKAKSLIQMKKNGFNVPDGLVVDSDTYYKITKPIQLKIQDALKIITSDNITEISNKITSLFDTIKIDNVHLDKIFSLIDENKEYAVRSSGAKEDLDNYSFAGQYKTFLNTKKEDIEKRIVACYKSMFSEVILSYFVKNKISFENMAMSVVIQEMVASEYSGVCFTVNPITGNDKEMLVEVAEGLGEDLVSGKNTPEQYHYCWYDDTFEFDENNHYLDKNQLSYLSKTFFDIQYYYGYPCDIEFAIKNGELFILQARKITKIKYKGYEDIWSTADFKDGGVSSTICYPYMWSLYEYIWEYTLRKFLLDSRILNQKEVDKKLGEMFYARPYWNVSVVKLAMSKIVGYKEREFDSEFGVASNYEGDGKVTKLSLKSIAKIINIAIAQRKIVKERNESAEKLKDDLLNTYFEYKNDYDNNKIKDIKSEWKQLTKDEYLKSESTYFWQIFINTVHQSLYKDSLLKYFSESEYLALLGGIDDISHLRPFYKMWDISRIIRKNKKLNIYWQNTKIEQILEELNTDRQDFAEIRKLIEEYGYHSDKELDITYECYYEDATPFLISIKDMISLDDGYSPKKDKEKAKKAYTKILNDLKEKISKSKYLKVENKINNMRKMLWWREEFRDVSTRFYYLIRIYTIELSQKLVEENVLKDIEDIWFLKVGDLWNFLDGKKTAQDLEEIIRKNKRYYFAYKNYISENEIGEVFANKVEEINDASDIIGLGANSGNVTGTARVIQSFDEIDRLEKDDILVTKFTDTGWTPKFAIISGIVTEYGGILCHAAIVSREYGIPAIVNCKDVMKKIKDGQTIQIDGGTGTVRIIE